MATLSFSITVPDAKRDEIVEYFVKNQGYQDTVDGQPNPETRNQAARRFVLQFLKENYKAYKVKVDTDAARTSAAAAVDGVAIT